MLGHAAQPHVDGCLSASCITPQSLRLADSRMLMPHRLRISLGLKPLAAENESDMQRKAQQEREALKAEGERAQKAAELAERVKAYVPTASPCLST